MPLSEGSYIKKNMKIMIDTNIIISAAIFRGSISSLLEEITRRYKIFICDFSVKELKIVIKNKFPNYAGKIDVFLNELIYEMIYTPKNINFEDMPYVRDKKRLSDFGGCFIC